jgi:hypothetical protein
MLVQRDRAPIGPRVYASRRTEPRALNSQQCVELALCEFGETDDIE